MAKAQIRDQAPQKASYKKTAKAAASNGRTKHGKPSNSAAPKLLFAPRPDWHTAELLPISTSSAIKAVPPQLLENIQFYAKSLLESEASNYTATHVQASSSYKFMSTIMASGTWSDKVSALTLVVQESPMHALKPLENLVALAGKRSRTQALMALEALKDMLSQGHILPDNRKLRLFTKQPELLAALQGVRPSWTSDEPLPETLTKQHLVFWAYEDHLKAKYFEILKILESWCNDEVEFARLRAVSFVWELLKERPEQEENLLRLLVNKLGDNSKKVSSRASHLLLQLQATHPSMKSIIIGAIESDVLLRPGQNSHAKYYGVITLNQTVLQTSDPTVANRLLDVYFSLFVAILNRSKKSGPTPLVQEEDDASKKRKRSSHGNGQDATGPEQELEEKIIAQVLTGINRAFPFSAKDSGTFEKHVDTMFKITHSSNFNTSVQALVLIQQISSSHNISTDRFLRTLYESLLDPRLVRSSKHTMYLNLLYRSLKSDVSVRRVKAFVKRLLQIMELHDPPFVCALLYLIIELQNLFPGVKAMLEQPETQDEDEEEAFADVPDEDDERPEAEEASAPISTKTPTHNPSSAYDGRKRDPEHSNADKTCLWELTPWTNHYHPSVTLFATYLASNTSSRTKTSSATNQPPPKPDPASHSLIQFLDRFVYRKPKAAPDSSSGGIANLRGISLMQPALASSNTTDSLLTTGRRGGPAAGASSTAAAPLNTENFWAKRVEDVAPDEVFFHRYFAEVGPRRKAAAAKAKKGKGAGDEDDGGVDDADGGEAFGDEDEEEIWKALVGSRGDAGVGGDDGGDDEDDDEDDDEEFDYDDDDGEDIGVDMDVEADDEVDVDVEGGLEGLELEGQDEEDEEEFNLEDDDASAMFSSEAEEDEIVAASVPQVPEMGGNRHKRRRLKDLPTFASAEDYAELIGRGDANADEGEE